MIEELQSEIEKLETDAAAKEQENSLAGRMSDIVNQARYKSELDKLKLKMEEQTKEQKKTIEKLIQENHDEINKLYTTMLENDSQIRRVEGDKNVSVTTKKTEIVIQKVEADVRIREIQIPNYIFYADSEIKVKASEQERQEIT